MAFSTQRAVSDGTLQDLLLEIKYIDREDINVFIDDVPQVLGVDYSWISDVLIRFTTEVPLDAEVLLQRATKLDNVLNIFTLGAVFDDPTMDENFRQMLYIAQEAREGSTLEEIFTNLNMHGYRVQNLGAGTEPGDAINYQQYMDDALGAGGARVAAEAARNAAIAARDAAQGFASSASTSAGTAAAQAGIATTKAGEAETARAAAEGFATTATTQASIATTQAGNANSSASLAAQWADKAENSPVVGSPDRYSAMHWAAKAATFAASVDPVAIDARFDAVEARTGVLEGLVPTARWVGTVAGGVLTVRKTSGAAVTVVRTGVGAFTVTFSALPDAWYYLSTLSTAVTGNAPIVQITAKSTTGFLVQVYAYNGTPIDPLELQFTIG